MLDSSTAIVAEPVKADLDEARETMRYLRDQAVNHYETLNNWLIADLCDQALAALGQRPRNEQQERRLGS